MKRIFIYLILFFISSNSYAVKVALIHFSPKKYDKLYNIKKLTKFCEYAAKIKAKLIITPELSTTGYSFKNRDDIAAYVDTIPDNTVNLFRKIALNYNTNIILGLAEKDEKTEIFYNSAVFIRSDGKLTKYRKKRCVFSETRWAKDGDLPIPIITTNFGKVSMLICADTFYPDAVRIAALKGAEILAVLANWPGENAILKMRARAIENGIYIAFANRGGKEKEINFENAYSIVVSPDGEVLKKYKGRDKVIFCNIDLSKIKRVRKLYPFLKLRRPEIYQDLVLNTFKYDIAKLFDLPKPQDILVGAMKIDLSLCKNVFNFISFMLEKLKNQGKHLDFLCLSEFFYCNHPKDFSEVLKISSDFEKVVSKLVKICRKYKLYIVTGILEKFENKFFRSSILVSQDGVIGKYRKTHLLREDFDLKLSYGNKFPVFKTKKCSVGLLVSEDIFFPEAAEVEAHKGADIVFVPASSLDKKLDFLAPLRVDQGVDIVFVNKRGLVGIFYKDKGKVKSKLLKEPWGIIIAKINTKYIREKYWLENLEYNFFFIRP